MSFHLEEFRFKTESKTKRLIFEGGVLIHKATYYWYVMLFYLHFRLG